MIIRLYQTFIPKRFRGKCLFKESCSNYVYRITKEDGLKAGIVAFRFRFHNCRPDYSLFENGKEILLITVTGEVIEECFIDEKLLSQHKKHK